MSLKSHRLHRLQTDLMQLSIPLKSMESADLNFADRPTLCRLHDPGNMEAAFTDSALHPPPLPPTASHS